MLENRNVQGGLETIDFLGTCRKKKEPVKTFRSVVCEMWAECSVYRSAYLHLSSCPLYYPTSYSD